MPRRATKPTAEGRNDGSWSAALSAGFVAGVLFGEVYLGVGLVRVGRDLLVTSVDGRFAAGLVLRSAGLYALLFGVAGVALASAAALFGSLRARAGRVLALVSGVLGGAIALAYLTVHRQIDDLAGVPLDDPQRWSGALVDLVIALVSGLAAGAVLTPFARRWDRSRARGFRLVGTLVVVLLALVLAGSALLRRGGGDVRAEPPRRVVVVGLDGMTFRVLSPLLREGRLPTFQRLVDEGAWGNVMTYGTASSARIWTSMATGKRVRDHGIDDFVKVGRGYGAVPFKSSDRKVKAIWNILSELDRRVAVGDWLFTFPPETVNGAIVSRLQLHAEDAIYPPELSAELAPLLAIDDASEEDETRSSRSLRKVDRAFDVGEHLAFDGEGYDFVAIYDSASDAVEHTYWRYHEPAAFDPDLWQITRAGLAEHGSAIVDVYEAYDRRLERLLAGLGEDTLVIVISDHGQRAARRPKITFRLNRVLADLGFASVSRDGVDFDASRAFQLPETLWKPTLRVNLNVAGREPRGTVPPEDADGLRREIVGALEALRLADGRRVFRRVRSESFGDRAKTKADIEVFLAIDLGKAGTQTQSVEVGGRDFPLTRYVEVETKISGNHDRQGVLFLRGPGVRPGYVGQRAVTTPLQELVWNLTDKVEALEPWLPVLQRLGLLDPVTTLDLTPMVLHALGEGVAKDMSGSPREFLWRGLRPVEWIETYESGPGANVEPPAEVPEVAPSDEEELERLKALGYVS